MISPETRASLLDGSAYGLPSVTTAPQWAADRIVEVRAALAAKSDVPAPTREFILGAEKRSLLDIAKGFTRTLFPTRTAAPVNNLKATLSPAQLSDLSRRSGVSVAAIQTIGVRGRAKRLGEKIARDLRELDRATSTATAQLTADEIRREFNLTMGWQ
jgi:hypothetical protein